MAPKNAQLLLQKLKQYFKFDQYQAIFKKEIIVGLSTFLAMAYILAVNPAIVGFAPLNPADPTAGLANQFQGGLFLATAVAATLATFIMGLFARIPVALAPGMGLNVFFAFTVAQQVGFASALSITILSGIGYFLVVITPAREKIANLMPTNLKLAIGVAIGFFIGFIGLQNARIIVSDPGEALATQVGNFGHPLVILALCLLVIAFILHYAKIPGAIVITMLLGAIVLIPMIMTKSFAGANPDNINPALVGYQGFSTFSNVIQAGWTGFANVKMWQSPITYIGTLSFLYIDFFDTTGTLITIDKVAQVSQQEPKWLAKANIVDAVSTVAGAGIGATTVSSFIESTVGISAGAKTGFSAIITALCLASTIALWPVMQIFMPVDILNTVDGKSVLQSFQPITGPILILVGAIMIGQIKHFEWEIMIDIPALFMTVIMMMLSNSIAYGIGFGVLTFVLVNAGLGTFQALGKKQKRIVNTLEIPFSTAGVNVKTREFYYLKRLNWGLVTIALLSLIYIIFQTGISYYGWFH